MLPFVRDFVHYFVVTLPLLLFGLIDASEAMALSDLMAPSSIQSAILRYWLPGLVGLILPPVLFWWCLRAVQSND